MNILFTNAGRRTYIIEYAVALKNEGYDISVFVSDASPYTAAFYVSDQVKRIITPYVENNELVYVQNLLKVCIDNEIDIVIPLMDYELPILAEYKELFSSHKIIVVVSESKVIDNCLNKDSYHSLAAEFGFKCPQNYKISDDFAFPVIKKRTMGSGSVGLQLVSDMEELELFYDEKKDVIQQYISGIEFGMDIFNDLDGNFVHSCPRRKITMRAGETDKAETLYSERFNTLAQLISSSFRHIGNMDVDFIVNSEGEVYFIDFNPRFGGGYPFTHMTGFNYLKALIHMAMNKPCDFLNIQGEYNTWMKSISIIGMPKGILLT
ncbi:MAG TPA: ATP-grasp domain-containing protein [Candidatus Cloacimonadota bacterium]|nr:ATP-grasp domain-containing protein [Candidatus Cloacimonadota bacterium]